jgi:GNAT superfamily N-acetyltransferase
MTKRSRKTGTDKPAKANAGPVLAFRPVTRATWRDFEALFQSPGAPKYCWCMAWRGSNEERKEWAGLPQRAPSRGAMSPANERRKAAMKRRVDAGTPIGLVAYDASEPIGWVSVAPRPTYRELGGPDEPADDPDAVWSVVCFFIRRSRRGAGLSRALLAAAIDYAKTNGAKIVEAYPVDPDSPSYRFMGFKPLYEGAGFAPVGRAGTRRTVMRRKLVR